MSSTTPKSAFWLGVRDALPFILIAAPFGLLFGVVASEAGLDMAQLMVMTSVVIAGASQFTALQLMSDNAPTLVVVATALAVNLRMTMYSAALTPHIGKATLWKRALMSFFLFDQNYGISILRFEKHTDWSLDAKVAYFIGTIVTISPIWIIAGFVGALVGSAIPPEAGLDFALPITFIAMVAPALRTVAHIAAAVTSVALTLAFSFIPYSLGLILAALIAMAVGAWIEVQITKRQGTLL